jgi:LGFP repeat/Domain of unknown function (DUF4832)
MPSQVLSVQAPYNLTASLLSRGLVAIVVALGTFLVTPVAQAGSITVSGVIGEKYTALGGVNSVLGAPVSNEFATANEGRGQRFTFGSIYWTTATGAHEIQGAIGDFWRQRHAEQGFLGYPLSDETPTADGNGRYNLFRGGAVFWSQATGAHEVHGAIRDKWAALGWERGLLGYPLTDETATPDGTGRFNHFTGGSIYWTPATGAREVHGAIRDKWAALGWERGLLGYPLTDETTTPDGTGRFNHFTGGSIYWTPTTGAHEVHGAIRDAWAASGWEAGAFGFPVSNEYDMPGGRRSDFQGGSMTWSASTGVVTLQSKSYPPPGGDMTLTTTAIARTSDPEITNVDRGFGYWGQQSPPEWYTGANRGGDGLHIYNRFKLNDIIIGGSPNAPTYNWGPLDQIVNIATSRKGRVGFRLMSILTTGGGALNCAPPFLNDTGHGGYFGSGGNYGFYLNHNHPDFLLTMQRFWQAVGARYANTPAMKGAWVEPGPMGNWGEWHDYDVAAPSSYHPTDANQRLLVDYMVQGAPFLRVMALKAEPGYAAAVNQAMVTYKGGWRTDNAGQSQTTEIYAPPNNWFDFLRADGALTTYRQAPVFFEPMGGGIDLNLLQEHINVLGASVLYNGNRSENVADFDTKMWVSCAKQTGYRYQLNSVNLPSALPRGRAFNLTSSWVNVNKAPTYDSWAVTLQLRSGTNVAWQGVSTMNLKTLYDGGSRTNTDLVTLPTNLATGTYTLVAVVKDPNNYFDPMKLAVTGRAADGSYSLGTVTVQ